MSPLRKDCAIKANLSPTRKYLHCQPSNVLLENGYRKLITTQIKSLCFKNQKNHSRKLPTAFRKQTFIFTFQIMLSQILHYFYVNLDF